MTDEFCVLAVSDTIDVQNRKLSPIFYSENLFRDVVLLVCASCPNCTRIFLDNVMLCHIAYWVFLTVCQSFLFAR